MVPDCVPRCHFHGRRIVAPFRSTKTKERLAFDSPQSKLPRGNGDLVAALAALQWSSFPPVEPRSIHCWLCGRLIAGKERTLSIARLSFQPSRLRVRHEHLAGSNAAGSHPTRSKMKRNQPSWAR